METIQRLRELTGAGVMDCKKALEEAGGDFDAAAAILRSKGATKAAKRADRATAAGVVECYVHQDRVGVVVVLRSETDFVARSEPFRELAHTIAMQIAAMGGETADAVLAQEYIRDSSRTVSDLVNDVIARTGENITLGEFYRVEL